MELLFLICLTAGVGWAFIVGILGPLFGGIFEHAGHIGGEDAHADVHHGESTGDQLVTPMSPYVISAFMATFGGIGLISVKALGLGAFGSLLLASPSAVVVAAIFFYSVKLLSSLTQASSEAHVAELVGAEAVITVPVPAGGVGEISYFSLGTRYTAPARSEDHEPIDRETKVYISRVDAGVYYVKKMSSL